MKISFRSASWKLGIYNNCKFCINRRIQLLIGIGMFLCLSSYAQVQVIDNNTLNPSFDVGHSYIQDLSETVNPANGSVSLNIGLPVPKGRGIALPFSLNYSSGGVTELQAAAYKPDSTYGSVQGSYWANKYPPGISASGGWSYGIPSVSLGAFTETCSVTNGNSLNGTDNWVFTESSGTQHPLLVTSNTASCGQDNPVTYPASGDDHVWATLGQPAADSAIPPVIVSDQDGTIYSFSNSLEHIFPVAAGTPSVNLVGSLPETIEDRNGNKITWSDATYQTISYKDTLGRTTFSLPWQVASPGTYSISVGGLTYSITWSTISASYNVSAVQDFTTESASYYAPLDEFKDGNLINCTSIPSINLGGMLAITAIKMPNGQSYSFQYNSWGLLQRIQYPTGAWVQYTWKLADQASDWAAFDGTMSDGNQFSYMDKYCLFHYKNPVVATRSVGPSGSTNPTETQVFTYATQWNASSSFAWDKKTTNVVTTDALRGLSKQTIYTYSPNPVYTNRSTSGLEQFVQLPNYIRGYTGPLAGYVPVESSIQYFDWGNTASSLQTVNQVWGDYQTLKSSQTVLNNSMSSLKAYTYTNSGAFLVPSETDEYDYGQSTPARKTVVTYQPFSGSLGSLADMPCKKVIYGASGSVASETDYYYDGGSNLCVQNTSGMTLSSVQGLVTGTHDEVNYAADSTLSRGNVTRVVQINTAGSSPSNSYTYDETGQVTSSTDAKSGTTSYSYSDSPAGGNAAGNSNAYITQITDPMGHAQRYQYDYVTGNVSESIDANSQLMEYQYDDPLNRLTQTSHPDGGKISILYNDDGPSPSVTVSTLISANTTNRKVYVMDSWGRVVQTQLTSDPEGTDLTTTTYDGMGLVASISNPYRSTSDSTYGVTQYSYDGLKRKTSQTESDGSNQAWLYTGNTIDFRDETGRHWQRTSDAFNRLIKVLEPDSSNNPTLETDYQYDALNNLLRVDQWGGPHGNSGDGVRTFTYDSLSRLLCASNPENSQVLCPSQASSSFTAGTVGYAYDANGNLQTKRDARGVVTSYTYDSLNRLITKTYSDGTPEAYFGYDQTGYWGAAPCSGSGTGFAQCNTVGRLSSISSSAGQAGAMFSYDAMGRVILKSSCIATKCGSDRIDQYFTYDLAGDLTSYDHGADAFSGAFYGGHGMTYDGAGRLQSLTTYQTPSSPTTLFTATSYGPIGLLNSTLGDGLNETRSYDIRMRQDSYNVVDQAAPATATISGTIEQAWNADVQRFPNLSIPTQSLPQNGNLVVGGWAGNAVACPLAAVEIDLDGSPLGDATLGISRPDVQSGFYNSDGKHEDCGYGFTGNIGDVAPGNHQVQVYGIDADGHRTALGIAAPSVSTTITVTAQVPPSGWVDASPSGNVATGGLLNAGGWAIDSQMHAPVAAVKVLVDGTPIGYAILNAQRPDVAAAKGDQRYLNSGWNFTGGMGNVATGSHTTSYVIYDSGGQSTTMAGSSFNVVADPAASSVEGHVDNVSVAGGTSNIVPVNGKISVSGWFGEPGNPTACASNISRVDVLIDGRFVGQAPYGGARPDVVSGRDNSSCLNTGYDYEGPIADVDPGVHLITVRGYDEAGGSVLANAPMEIQINAQLTPASVANSMPSQYAWSLGFAPNGNVSNSFDSVNGTFVYLYDNLNRLTSATSQTYGLDWTYDANGNRLSQLLTSGTGTSYYTNFNGNHDTNISYDASGNALTTLDYGSHLTYDAENRLISSGTTTYLYDANGQRVAKYSGGSLSNVYLYDLDGHVVTELNGSFNVIRREVYAGDRHLGSYDQDGNLTYVFTDWLGTERAREGSAGSLCQITTSQPFGDNQQISGACLPSPDFFTGKPRDPESGLDYFGARYYASTMGRWTSPDWSAQEEPVPYAKLGNPQSLNLYAYVKNNPMSYADADGHMSNAYGAAGEDQDCVLGGGDTSCGSMYALVAVEDTTTSQQGASPDSQAQQQVGQDPTLPTAAAPATSWVDRLMNAIFPKTWGDMASLALMVPTDGLGELPAAAEGAIKLTSSIGEDAKLTKYAQEAGKSVQQGLDSLTKELAKGNTNPGLGTKSLGKGISYARARDGARVFFRQAGNQIDVVGKASKANESAVINYLKSLY